MGWWKVTAWLVPSMTLICACGISPGTPSVVDAKVEKVRDGGRVVRKAFVVAHAVHESGRREIIGLDVG